MSWHPMPGWLLVRPVETEDRVGSLYAPQQAIAAMTRTQHEVVAFGGPAPRDPEAEEPETIGDFAPGDWLLAPQRMAFHVPEEGVTFLSARNIWALLTA